MNYSCCAECAAEIGPDDDTLECLLCVFKTHTSCVARPSNAHIPIELVTATPQFYFICGGCNILVSSKRKRKIFRKCIGSALQQPAEKTLQTQPNGNKTSNDHPTRSQKLQKQTKIVLEPKQTVMTP